MNGSMAEVVVARKYAQAFVNVYAEEVSLRMLTLFDTASSFLRTNRNVILLLSLPHMDQEQRVQMVHQLVDYFSLPSQCEQLFTVLLSHNRSFLIPIVLWYIVQIYKKRVNIIDFSILSSDELDSIALEQIKRFLEHKTGKEIMYSHRVDKKLIAGICLSSDEYVWEYSVRKHINAIARSTHR
jgi:ATP synthase F1 delta subunit